MEKSEKDRPVELSYLDLHRAPQRVHSGKVGRRLRTSPWSPGVTIGMGRKPLRKLSSSSGLGLGIGLGPSESADPVAVVLDRSVRLGSSSLNSMASTALPLPHHRHDTSSDRLVRAPLVLDSEITADREVMECPGRIVVTTVKRVRFPQAEHR